MSSMRNAVTRRVHRERAQPAERERLGILEKHKVRRVDSPSERHLTYHRITLHAPRTSMRRKPVCISLKHENYNDMLDRVDGLSGDNYLQDSQNSRSSAKKPKRRIQMNSTFPWSIRKAHRLKARTEPGR